MLRVLKPSGAEALSMNLAEWLQIAQAMKGLPDILSLKRQLHSLGEPPRFRQRLLLDGSILGDEAVVDRPMDLQLVVIPFCQKTLSHQLKFVEATIKGTAPAQVEGLLQQGIRPGVLDVYRASSHGNLDVVRLLLEAEAELHDEERHCRLNPLVAAAVAGHCDVVQALLEASASINKAADGCCTALEAASSAGHAEVVRSLLGAGAERNVCDAQGATPLFFAVRRQHAEVVRALLEARADPDIADRLHGTPLTIASRQGHSELVRLLLEFVADKEKATKYGQNPLLEAARKGHVEVVSVLLKAGANIDHRDHSGATALTMATAAGRVEVVQRLLEARCDGDLKAAERLLEADAEDQAAGALARATNSGSDGPHVKRARLA